MELRRGRRVIHLLHAHLVFVTKRRGRVFDAERLRYLEEVFQKICGDFECDLVEFNGEADHVHLLVQYPPKICLARLVNSLKGVSSRRLKQQFPAIADFWSIRKSKNALWSPSYFAGSAGGVSLGVLKQYIEQQGN